MIVRTKDRLFCVAFQIVPAGGVGSREHFFTRDDATLAGPKSALNDIHVAALDSVKQG